MNVPSGLPQLVNDRDRYWPIERPRLCLSDYRPKSYLKELIIRFLLRGKMKDQ